MVKLIGYLGSGQVKGAYQDIFVAQRYGRFWLTPYGKVWLYRVMRKFLRRLMPYGPTFTGINPNWSQFLTYMETLPNEVKLWYQTFVQQTLNSWYSEVFIDCRQCKKKYNEYTAPDVWGDLTLTTIQTVPYKIVRASINWYLPLPWDYDNAEYFDVFTNCKIAGTGYLKKYLIETVKANPVITGDPGDQWAQQDLFDFHCPECRTGTIGVWAWLRNFKYKSNTLGAIKYFTCP